MYLLSFASGDTPLIHPDFAEHITPVNINGWACNESLINKLIASDMFSCSKLSI